MLQPCATLIDQKNLHLNEVEMLNGYLVTSGVNGNVATAVGNGRTIEAAINQVYALAKKVIVPNIRYRQDIGANLLTGDLQQLIEWGYVDLSINNIS